MAIQNDNDLRRLAEMYRDGRIPEAAKPQVMREMREYDARRKAAAAAAAETEAQMETHQPDRPWYKHGNPDAKEVSDLSMADYAMGIYEMAAMAATGAVAQPISGVGGMVAGGVSKLFGSEHALENAAKTQEWLAGALTNDPEGEAMKTFGALIGETAATVTQKIDDGLYAAAGGNAEIATGLKTALYGIPSVVGLGRMKIPTRIKTDIQTHKDLKRVAREAEESGYTLDTEMLPGQVRKKVHEMVPDERIGHNFDDIVDELRAAHNVSREAVDDAYDAARASQSFLEIKPLRLMAKQVKGEFEARYNTKGMPRLQDHLTDLRRLASSVSNTGKKLKKRRTEVDYNEIELLRQRITNDITGQPGKGNYTPQDRALLALRSRLDDTIDDLWARGAVSGDPAAIELWQKARGLARGHAQRFDADKVVKRLILEDHTPESAYRLIMGSSAMGAKPQAVQTLRRLKEVLGEDHPVLVNVRKAMIRDVVMPALGEKANFGALGINIDKLLKNNYSLVTEAGFDVNELRKLRAAAHVANETVRLSPEKFGAEYVNSVIASVAFGHGIARKGAFVRTVKKILNRTMGVGLMSKSEIRRHLLDADLDRPIRDYSGPELGYWLAMSAGPAAANYEPDTTEEEEQ